MNKTYRTVWNPTTGTWVAAAETARSQKKSNSTMRSSVTAAVAVMAGVGGSAIAIDAGAQTANGNGALNLCGGANGGVGHTFGYSGATTNANCSVIGTNNPVYRGHAPSFVLGNGGDLNGAAGVGSTASTASVAGSRDGHVMIYGANGVHITGTTDFANAVSMTNNRIQNLAAGTAGTDAVNLNQLNAAIAATDDKFVAISTGTYAADVAASAASSATAIGANASAAGTSAVALGGNTTASATNAVALGTLARATSAETTAVGVGAAATGQNASVLGRGALASGGNSVALGAFSVADRANSVSVGTAASQRQITNVAAGTVGTDAVNVNQLNAAIAASDPYFMVNSTSANHANATGANAVAIGQNVTSSGSSSVALGSATAAGGFHSVAIGASASTVGDSNVALGDGAAVAQSNRFVPTSGVAIGTNARVIDGDITGATGSIAIGNSATAGGTGTIAIGTNARHTGSGATVLGSNASAMGGGAGVAVGSGSSAAGSSSVATGPNATATGTGSVAIGSSAATAGNNSVALGNTAAGSAINTTAIGSNAKATGTNATVLGQSASASGLSAVGIGFRANAQADNSVALGMDSVANRNNTVSVGSATQQRQITNLAAGTAGTDAVNVAQLNAAIANVGGSNPYVKANGAGDGSDDASATGVGSVAIGSNAKTLVDGGVAVGRSATAGMANSVAIGNDAVASQDGVAIGRDARAQNANAISIGAGSAAGQNGTSLGNNALAGSNALALGTNASATGNNSVALGNGSVALADNTVSVGSAGNERKIVNVADGTLSATSKDAVNGAQLFATNTRVGSLEDSLARGGVIDPVTGESLAVVYDGTAKDKVTLGGGTAGTTLSNVKAGVADKDAVNVSQLKGSGLVGDDGSAIAAVTYNRNADGTPNYDAVTLGGGKSAGPVTLSNVADGVNRNDAVNLGQLQDSGLVAPVDPTNPGAGVTSLAVTYGKNADGSANFDEVKLKGTNGTTLANVKAGVADTDAVNVSQLKGSGLVGDDGKAIAAVTYNRNADGTPNYNAVTLGGGKSAGPVTLSNVATGVAATDAVNVQQLQQTVANGNPYIGGRGTGVAAQATGLNAIALGLGSVADEIRTVSVGNSATGLQRRITNVQNGEADSDAATVGQVNDLMGIASTNAQAAIDNVSTTTTQAIQDVNSRLDAIGTLAGTDPYVQVDGLGDGSDNASVRAGTYGVAIGAEASATGDTAIAIGAQSRSTGSGSVALGAGASATGTGAVAFGSGVATGTSALALGNGTNASGNNAVAAGFNARAAGVNALALGNTARANAADSLAFGTGAQVDPLATNSIAIGRQSSVTGTALNSVALGASSVADRLNSVSVGSTGQQRQIIYVARGTANTDAVNVSQLKDAVAAFGGNASVGADGSIVNPTYTIGGTTYRNVGDALDALANLGGGGGGTDPLAVTYGRNSDGTPNFEVVTLKGTDGTTLSNVKAGVADKDAVNVSQLKDSGLIGGDGKAIAAVTYDRNADGSPNLGSVTLGGGANGTTLSNVKAGVADKDAVNVSQLKGSGLIGDDGKSIAAVTYDRNADGTPNLGSVTLGGGTAGTTLSNVKAGVADKDAVNVSQLKGSGLIGDDGKAIAAVTYDRNADGTPNYRSVTLGDGTNPTQLKHVANATEDSDALNLGQLKDSGLVGDDGSGNLTSLAVTYDSATKDKVTLGGGTAGTTLANVKAGVADKDAVNVSQLKGSGLIGDDGKAIAAVTYDRNTDGTPNYRSVTLGDGTSLTQLKHVANATEDSDALNLGQLKDSGLVGDDGSGNLTSLAVTYDSATKDKVTLGGGTDGTTLANVKAGVADKDAVNVSQLKGSGLIGDDGKAIAAVTYDRNADGSPNYRSVTLGDGTNPTQLKHVANATEDSDALNLGQLKDSGLVGDDGSGNLTSLAVTYDSATKDKVTLGGGTDGTTLANVKAGVADKDAVNVSQLKGSGLIGDDGKAIAAVTYDRNADGSPNYRSVTLGDGTNATQLKHVANGTDRQDAVNLGQLQDSGLVAPVDPTNPGAGVTSLAVTYSQNADNSANYDEVKLKGTNGTTLTNVKAGVADADAVNVSQLKGSGLIGDDGKAIAAVTYDRNADGSPNYRSVTLGDGTNPTQLKHVANATEDSDALNLGQLKDSGLVGDDGSGNLTSLAVTYDSATKDKVTLGGGTAGTTLTNVKAGVADADAVNVSQLKGSGLIGDDGKSIAAVTYDRNADGTPNYRSVTLGDGTNPTQLKHVANATEDSDALNLGQLKSSGLVGDDGSGNLTSLAVTYDSATKDKVTLGGGTAGTTLTNVKAGVADADAVNVSQLKGSGLIGDDGKAIAAVTYNRNADGTPNYNAVTLGGGKSAGPVTLSNVADGVNRDDAVNLGQLQDSGLVAPVDPTNPGAGVTSLAVTYGKNADGSANYDEVKLKGTNGTTLSNVKAGVADADAVNVSQLKGSGLIGDDGKAIAAVTYDRNTDGSPNYNVVTLGGGKSAGPVQLKNVAAGTDGTDAVNVAQLKDAGLVAPVDPTNPGAGLASLAVTYGTNADGSANFDEVKLKGANGTTLTNVKAGAVNAASTDAVNGSQLYGVSKSVADSLGGGSAVDANGNVTAPTYSLTDPANAATKVDYRNVGDALDNLDGRVATNTQNITVINNQLADSGLVDPVTGQSIAAVTYDRNANGTPNYNAVTLGGGKSAGPVQLKNVAAGTDDTDAVNVAQLKDAGLVAPVDPTNPGAGVTSLAVTYSQNADESANFDEVKLKGTNGTTLTNVAAGAVNATSTDAINGSQLHGTAQSVADTLGGGTTVDADGKLANASFEVKGNRYSTVEQAIQAAAAYGATDSLAVRYDLNADGTPNYGSVTLGGTGAAPVKLTNVADGTSQYDAVNFGQLSALNDKIGDLDDRVGGLELRPGNPGDGNGGGSGTNPYFGATDQTAGGSSAANPGTGTGNVAAGSGSSVGTGVNDGTAIGSGSKVAAGGGTAIGAGSAANGENATSIGQGSNATGSGSVAIGSGAVANEANTVSFGDGTDTGNRRVVNIADGINANDAATKGQLDRAVGGLSGQINDVSRNAYSGIAAATALTMIPGVDPGKTLSFGVGGATYKGYQAVAFGGEARITQNLKMKAGVGLSSGGNTVGVGASYQW
ncbi:YadA-like family protein [Burkholderia sp. AU18528]|uniref:YadA-like family protein n=1 Tax=Burkholderia sp. AU18528 TaxID=2015350 RepID=UPI00211F1878|nr:YadA-like family protein [Burkholderia sp. AU18528]